jgi:hypothetical protein
MAVINVDSKRRKAELKAGQTDVFQYDTVPRALRAQVVHIWRDALGSATSNSANFERWNAIHEYGYLRRYVEDGVAGSSNNAGGHGEEPSALPVPAYIAAHALHLSAANIVMAVEAFKALDNKA